MWRSTRRAAAFVRSSPSTCRSCWSSTTRHRPSRWTPARTKCTRASLGRFERPHAGAHQARQRLDPLVADAMGVERLRGPEEIVVRRAIAPAGAGERFHHHLLRNRAGVAGALPIHGEGEGTDLLASDLAVEPLGAVGAESHLAFPDALHLLLHAIGGDAVHQAAAAAAA